MTRTLLRPSGPPGLQDPAAELPQQQLCSRCPCPHDRPEEPSARYDLGVAEYYVKRDALIAAANRAKLIVETYPDTVETEKALEIMVNAYDTLKMPTLAQHAREVLARTARTTVSVAAE